jgi:hypothetical protein
MYEALLKKIEDVKSLALSKFTQLKDWPYQGLACNTFSSVDAQLSEVLDELVELNDLHKQGIR